MQLMAAQAELVHAHLAPAYPVRHGRGRTHTRAARDGRDRTPYNRRGSILSSSKKMFALKLYVASVCFKCFKYFRVMLQVFYIDVVKVDRDVTRNGVFKCIFQMFHLFQTYVASVSSECCICMHVASVCSKCFKCVLSECCKCFAMAKNMFSWCFRRMLEMFQLFRMCVTNVSSRCCKVDLGVAHVAVGPICSNHLLQLLGPVRARDTKRRGPWCGRRTRCGRRTQSKPGPQVKLARGCPDANPVRTSEH
jgi:hypothetical protein